MIFYNPTSGDAHTTPVNYRPRTCFLMTQLRKPVPQSALDIRYRLTNLLSERRISVIDAESVVTGKDFLMKIWNLILAVPLGVAIIHEDMKPGTLSNIFYELGAFQAYGKETLVIKTKAAAIPSNLVRTEYVEYDERFDNKIYRFTEEFLTQAEYYADIADQVESNPLLAIDYLRRAFIISGEEDLRKRAQEIFAEARLEGRAKNSVEMLLTNF